MVNDKRVPMNMSKLIDDATKISFIDWYRTWRNYPSPEIPAAPPSEVAFSSDYSSYEIGPDWYKQTIIPFTKNALKSDKIDTIFEDFIENHGVQVGQFVLPISDLPQDKPSVIDFLDKVEEAFDEAKASL